MNLTAIEVKSLKPTPIWDDLGYIGRGRGRSPESLTPRVIARDLETKPYHGGTETRRTTKIGKGQNLRARLGDPVIGNTAEGGGAT